MSHTPSETASRNGTLQSAAMVLFRLPQLFSLCLALGLAFSASNAAAHTQQSIPASVLKQGAAAAAAAAVTAQAPARTSAPKSAREATVDNSARVTQASYSPPSPSPASQQRISAPEAEHDSWRGSGPILATLVLMATIAVRRRKGGRS
ncbi:MAG: hypothetical protein V4731_08690 [Pseudomonadota bacterium]